VRTTPQAGAESPSQRGLTTGIYFGVKYGMWLVSSHSELDVSEMDLPGCTIDF